MSSRSSLVSNGTARFLRFSVSIQRIKVCIFDASIRVSSRIMLTSRLRQICSFSKAFYAYLTAICQGSQGNYTNLESFKKEIVQLTRSSSRKVRKTTNFLSSELVKTRSIPGHANNKISSSSNKSVSQRRKGPPKFLLLEIFGVWGAVSVECFGEC